MVWNPLAQQIAGTLLRYVLLFGAGYLVKEGIWTAEEADSYVAKLVEALLPTLGALAIAGWGVYKTIRKQKALVTAQALPQGSTTEDVKAAMDSPMAPPASLPADVQPFPIVPTKGAL